MQICFGGAGETTGARIVLFEPTAPVRVLPPLLNSLARDLTLERTSRHLDQFVAREGAGVANLVGQHRVKKAQPVPSRARIRPLFGLLDEGGVRSTHDAIAHASTREHSAAFSCLGSTVAIHAGDRNWRFGLPNAHAVASRTMFALLFAPNPGATAHLLPKNHETRLNKRVLRVVRTADDPDTPPDNRLIKRSRPKLVRELTLAASRLGLLSQSMRDPRRCIAIHARLDPDCHDHDDLWRSLVWFDAVHEPVAVAGSGRRAAVWEVELNLARLRLRQRLQVALLAQSLALARIVFELLYDPKALSRNVLITLCDERPDIILGPVRQLRQGHTRLSHSLVKQILKAKLSDDVIDGSEIAAVG